MPFEKDIFISYAHIDNQPLREGQKGWISAFHRALEIRLAQLLGEPPKIWRDEKLQGNDFFGDEIVDQFPKVATIIQIISPRYVKSEWCMREINSFCDVAEKNIGLKIGNKSRVFKIIKTPIPFEEHPPKVRDILGYEFYNLDQGTDRARELNQDIGSEEDQNTYWSKLDDVAHDLAGLLEEIKKSDAKPITAEAEEATTSKENTESTGFPIYLAESSHDIREQRDLIKRELVEYGYNVIPQMRLPVEVEDEYRTEAEQLIEKSKIALHLVGNSFGIVPEGTDKSTIVIQNEVSAEKSKALGIERMIWIPPGTEGNDERIQNFISDIKTRQEIQAGADIYETSLEELKFAVHQKVKKIQEKKIKQDATDEPTGDDAPKQIYLICDMSDLDNTVELEDFLFNAGYDVILPVFEGEESQIREDHQENLKLCDGAIIFYGEANELWMRSKTRDFLKIAGYGRKKPLNAKAVYIAPPATPQKQRFRSRDSLVIDCSDGFSEEKLKEFLSKI